MHPSRDNETGYLMFNMYEMSESDSIFWLAPDLYIGNKLQSYGSDLIFTMTWVINIIILLLCSILNRISLNLKLFFILKQVVVRGDTSGKPTFGPTIILIGENGMRIAYGDNVFLETNSTISIQLIEHDWYHIPQLSEHTTFTNKMHPNEYRGEHVTRSQFLSVLSNIECVMLRGTFHSDQVESILIAATIKSSKNNQNKIGSNLVEQCKCPIGYTGLSCESCDFGYVRAHENVTANEQLGICLPCSCNGHAETCDLTTKKCGECKHNTTGER